MGKQIKVHVEGYGTVKVPRPRVLNKDTLVDTVGNAVAQTMQLVHPRTQARRFHMAVPGGHAQ